MHGGAVVKTKKLPAWTLLFCVAAHGGESTPLLDAAYAGDADRVAALIRSGADVNAANQFGATPMAQAALRGDTEVLRLLLKAGADPDSPNAEGETALMIVARTGPHRTSHGWSASSHPGAPT
jgi:ankyrin repeat protein